MCITGTLEVNFSYFTPFFNIRTILVQTEEQRVSEYVTKIQNTEPEKELKKTACSVCAKFSKSWFTRQHV